MPYFEGDFWPNVLEESIKELDQEEEEKRKQAEAEAAAAEVTVPVEGGSEGPEAVSVLRCWGISMGDLYMFVKCIEQYVDLAHSGP